MLAFEYSMETPGGLIETTPSPRPMIIKNGILLVKSYFSNSHTPSSKQVHKTASVSMDKYDIFYEQRIITHIPTQ